MLPEGRIKHSNLIYFFAHIVYKQNAMCPCKSKDDNMCGFQAKGYKQWAHSVTLCVSKPSQGQQLMEMPNPSSTCLLSGLLYCEVL